MLASNQHNHLVIARNDSLCWGAVALAMAEARSFELFEDWGDLFARPQRPDAESYTLVASLDSLKPEIVERLVDRSSGGFGGLPFGLLTAVNLSRLTFLILKGGVYQHVNFDRRETVLMHKLGFGTEYDHGVTDWEELSREKVQTLIDGPMDVLALSSHGDNIDANLNAGVLCGRRPLGDSTLAREFLPVDAPCLVGDFCHRNRRRELLFVPIDSVRSKFIFNEACSGIGLAGGLFPTQLSLALGALEGYAAWFLSSFKVLRSTATGPLLVQALLASGLRCGEAALVFRAFHQAATRDQPSYLLLGDAATRLFPPSKATRAVALSETDDNAEGIELELRSSGSAALLLHIEGAAAEELSRRSELRVRVVDGPAGMAPAMVAVLPKLTGHPLSLLAFSGAPMTFAPMKLRIEPALDAQARLVNQFRSVERNVAFLGIVHRKVDRAEGLRDGPELKQMAGDLREIVALANRGLDHAKRIAFILSEQVSSLDRCDRIEEEFGLFRMVVAAADDILVRRWSRWNMPYYFLPFYSGHLQFIGIEERAGRCEYCNNPRFRVQLESPMRAEVRRTLHHCVRCGVTSDSPSEELPLRIESSTSCVLGETVEQVVRFRNNQAFGRRAFVSLHFERPPPWLRASCYPHVQEVSVSGGAEGTVAFSVRTDQSTVPGVYNLIAIAASHAALFLACKPFLIREPRHDIGRAKS
ncbi:MAG: hypothetical protein AMS22_01430 [Thiotrichales bacterium SG8_50]|nr:MAG: hypothetical protein AMS22_01430 [Thiotrichales bacterium SG8_50]